MGIRKSELMLRIIDLEMLAEKYEVIIDDLDKRLKKLEKPVKKNIKGIKIDKDAIDELFK